MKTDATKTSEEQIPQQEGHRATKLLSNFSVQAVGKAVSAVIVFVTFSLLSRYLGPADFGTYSYPLVYLGMFIVLIEFVSSSLLSREMMAKPREAGDLFASIRVARTAGATVLMLIAIGVAWFLPYSVMTRQGIMIMSILIVLNNVMGVYLILAQNTLKMGRFAIAEMCSKLIVCGLVIYGITTTQTLPYFFWSAVIGIVFTDIVLSFSFRNVVPRGRFRWSVVKKFVLLSISVGVLSIIGAIHFRVDSFLLGFLKPSYDLGIYSQAYRILEFVLVLPSMVYGLLLPYLTQKFKDNRLQEITTRLIPLMVFVGLVLMCSLFYFAPSIITITSGSAFSASVLPLRILSLSVFFMFVSHFFLAVLIVIQKNWAIAKIYFVAAVVNIGFNLLLIPRLSFVAAAASTLLSESLITAGFLWVVRRDVQFIRPRGIIRGAAMIILSFSLVWALFSVFTLVHPVQLLIDQPFAVRISVPIVGIIASVGLSAGLLTMFNLVDVAVVSAVKSQVSRIQRVIFPVKADPSNLDT